MTLAARHSPSVLKTAWAFRPWMNPPPRTGISRESGSVMLRTGPRSSPSAAAPGTGWAALALALASLAAPALTRQYSLPGTGGLPAGTRRPAWRAAFARACRAAVSAW